MKPVRSRTDRREGRERGQGLVETALSMMILVLLLMGMVDFGLAFAHRVALANASRHGARYASRYPLDCIAIQWVTVEALQNTLILGEVSGLENGYNADLPPSLPEDTQLEVNVANCGPYAKRWDDITVEVRHPYSPLFGGLLGIGDIQLAAATSIPAAGPDVIYEP
jgi:hypothetical protein